jgi:hypothetical protein
MNLSNIRHYKISRVARGSAAIGSPKRKIAAEEKSAKFKSGQDGGLCR